MFDVKIFDSIEDVDKFVPHCVAITCESVSDVYDIVRLCVEHNKPFCVFPHTTAPTDNGANDIEDGVIDPETT